MYVAVIPNRGAPPAILLRESYRQAGKTKNRTLANLSRWPAERIGQLRAVLRGDKLLPAAEAVEIVRALPHGHVLAALGTARRIALDALLPRRAPQRRRDLALALIVAPARTGGQAGDCADAGSQPFLVGNIERVLRNEIIVEPGEGLGALEEALGKSLLHPPVGLVVELPLPHWQRQVRRALEHRELSDVLVNLLDNLHPARPGADDADALALEVHALLRPQAGMVADAAEVLQPLDRRNIRFRGEPGAEHEEL